MLAELSHPGWRILRRRCGAPKVAPKVAADDPRVLWLDPYQAGDVWIARRGSRTLEVLFNQHVVARIRATALDQMALNEIVCRLRTHRPRRHVAS